MIKQRFNLSIRTLITTIFMEDQAIENKTHSYKTPWFTWSVFILILLQFLLFKYEEYFSQINMDTFKLFGAPDTVEIYQGHYWGVLTNNFLHTYWKLFFVNSVGIWFFGAFIERRIGFKRFFALFFFGCIIPSLWQLTLTNEPGIGLSGVNFTLFGYLLYKSRKDEVFRFKYGFIKYFFLVFMVGELIYCNYHNYFVENIYRTEAMTVAILLGLLLGRVSNEKRSIKYSIITFLTALSLSTLFYAPWSSEWQLYKGVQNHEENKFSLAKKYYLKALEINPENDLAKENLKLLKVDRLKSKAYDAHIKENYSLARRYYEEILILVPEDEWAKENLKELP